MKFLTRFQRLERARAPSPEDPGPETERFSALEAAAPLPEVRPPSSGRFAPPQTLPEAPLELDRGGGEAQPFVRCQACGRDSGRESAACGCGERLDTPEVAGFNAQLWAEMQAHRHEEVAAREQALETELAEAQRQIEQRRVLGEELAREVAERERWKAPLLPRWGHGIGLGLLALFLLRIHRPAALVLIGGALAVLGLWWWTRRPPGQ